MAQEIFVKRASGHDSDSDRVSVLPAITLWQPWASLIAIGAKRYETRSRPAPSRLIGRRIAIHAARRRVRPKDFDADTLQAINLAINDQCWMKKLPLGAVVCTAVLIEVLPVERVLPDLFGDCDPGRWAWRLEEVTLLQPPVPARGLQTWGWRWVVPVEMTQ
jgi:hypothetical protein